MNKQRINLNLPNTSPEVSNTELLQGILNTEQREFLRVAATEGVSGGSEKYASE